MPNGLNPYAAGEFLDEIDELPNDPDRIWQQKNIGSGVILYGFYEFRIENKAGKINVKLAGVSKLNILEFVKKCGYRKRYLKDSNLYVLVRVVDSIIEEVTSDLIRVQTFQEAKKKKAIKIDVGAETTFDFHKDLLHTAYLKNQDQIFNRNFLELMDEYTMPELSDTRNISYFLFSNEIIKVQANGIEPIPYKDLQQLGVCVWRSHIINREYHSNAPKGISEFELFVNNVANQDPNRIAAFKSSIGYLLHNYNGSHMGQAVVCYDETPTDVKNPQGGTGKGLFAQGLSHMREYSKIDGRFIRSDDKFRYQSVKITTEIVFIDDLSKDVPFDTFFSCLTDGWTIERKNLDQIRIEPEDSPKMLFSMNTVISGNGSSHKRRLFIIEFSDYYSKRIINGTEHPIEDEHGVLFDRTTWTIGQWDSFTSYMINCLRYYLQNGLHYYELINVTKNALIQSAGEDFAEWVDEKQFAIGPIYRTKDLFEEFKNRFYGPEADYKQRTFTNYLGKWAGMKRWEMKVKTDPGTKASLFEFFEKKLNE